MRKTIDGVVYDTLDSIMDKKFTFGAPGDANGYEETLYITKDGKYFVYTYGGKNSKYANEDITKKKRKKERKGLVSGGEN